MIEMRVMGIALDTRTGSPIVVLHDKNNRKALPIWIGSPEASSIIRKIENIKSTRPMTHDLILEIIEQLGYAIERIEINDVEGDTYFSTVYLKDKSGKVFEIDSRPSDAIAIAIRADVGIFVNEKVLDKGAISTDSAKDEQETQEFKQFIQNIKPSDFEKLSKNDFQSDQ